MSECRIDLRQGDCLEVMKDIPDGSIDLILTDPPYGVMKGIDKSRASKDFGYRSHDWDIKIDTEKLFPELSRILRPNGRAVLFAQEPYTSELVIGAIPSLPFSYKAVWKKNNFANGLGVNKAMVSYIEDILIFSKIHPKHDYTGEHPLRAYFLQERDKCGDVNFRELLGNGMAGHYFTRGVQFALPTRKNYEKLQLTGFFRKDYDEIKAIHEQYQRDMIEQMNTRYPNIFNLWEGGKFKSNVLEYAKPTDGYHPTQKPVKLLEDLIRTYSNTGNMVLDFTMGSGSTGVACVNTGRRFIGIELDQGYFEIAQKRIDEALKIKGGIIA